jgi:hypothetical protein
MRTRLVPIPATSVRTIDTSPLECLLLCCVLCRLEYVMRIS